MLDAIFADCFSRWGGRYNLIIPCENGWPRLAFMPWLEAYDPDIIYSYVDLNDEQVEDLNELLCPSFLVAHHFFGDERDLRSFRPDLPMEGLSSMSVCTIAANADPHFGRRPIKLVDNHPGVRAPAFIEENFGTFQNSSSSWPLGLDLSEYVESVTLSSAEIQNDKRIVPRTISEVVVGEDEYLTQLATRGDLVGPAQLSAWHCPRLDFRNRRWGESFNLVVGNSFSDRLMYWNARSLYPTWLDQSIVTLRVDPDQLGRDDFFEMLVTMLSRRNRVTTGSDSQVRVTIRSTSVALGELEELREKFKSKKTWHLYGAEGVLNIDDCVPSEGEIQHAAPMASGLRFPNQRDWQYVSSTGRSLRLPTVLPRHLRNVSPLPFRLRQGVWAQDIELQRENDLSRYINIVHRWRLPRRLRVTDAFALRYQLGVHGPICVPRVNGERMLTMFTGYDSEMAEIHEPEDGNLFRLALCQPTARWVYSRGGNVGRDAPAFSAKLSDKGQYLRAMLSRSGGLGNAEAIFLSKFWKAQFELVGGTAAATDTRIDDVIQTLKARLVQGAIETDDQWRRTARVVLAEARRVRQFQRYLRYDYLKKEFDKVRKVFAERHGIPKEKGLWVDLEDNYLPDSVQFLCRLKILHQGHEWRCSECGNNNWVSIDNISRAMRCDVCDSSQSPPVTNTWRFKLDSFILEGLREHGLLACVWCLSQLRERAEVSFYFAESMRLTYTKEAYYKNVADAEVDLMVVVDGKTYLCEVKSSGGSFGIDKLVEVAKRIRPDVVRVAVMSEASLGLDAVMTGLREALEGTGIAAELMTFDTGVLDDSPHLPR